MLTIRSAAELLENAASIESLSSLASAVGFAETPLNLDRDTRATLGLGDCLLDARVAAGRGTTRALIAECSRGELRDKLREIAASLTSRTPQLLWIAMLTERGGNGAAIATWSSTRGRPRVAALVVERDNLSQSDAETLCALAAVGDAEDLLAHARWTEILGRDALTRRFYRELESLVGALAAQALGRASDRDRHDVALLYVSRLLFISFLEAKGWMNGDRRFLEHSFAECMAAGGRFHERVLLPLFFGTLNTSFRSRSERAREFGRIPFLNGGLFSRTAVETRAKLLLPDDGLGQVFDFLLARYRFTAREDSASWSEAAVDPEMLGRVFESLMASRERRSSGSFYTPFSLVERATRAALGEALSGDAITSSLLEQTLSGGEVSLSHAVADLLLRRLHALRVLDPACGSGAFLVHALQVMALLAARFGDPRSPSDIRRAVLTHSIFGVDINPTAVWLCELRLWLCVVIESDETDPMKVTQLPNLDRNIRIGDTLAGSALGGGEADRAGGARVTRLRERYSRATGQRKSTLERALEREERALAIDNAAAELDSCEASRRELLAALRGHNLFGERNRPAAAQRAWLTEVRLRTRELRAALRSLRDGCALPFSFATHFPDAGAAGGFDVVIGNPPWVRLHRIPASLRVKLRARFEVFANARWQRGADAARAGSGFSAQVDLSALFLERSVALLRESGILALLLPAKLWRSLSGGGARGLVRSRMRIIAIEDWSEAPSVFDAAVYPSLLIARRERPMLAASPAQPISAALNRKMGRLEWAMSSNALPFDDDQCSPWLLVPTAVRSAFDRLRHQCPTLAESSFGPPLLGVKCGCNEAFVVGMHGMHDDKLAEVHSGSRSGLVERAILRPLIRGESVLPWSVRDRHEFLIWTHGGDGMPLVRLPPGAERWLAPWKRRLQARADARHKTHWWSIFRTASAECARPRIVWSDFGRVPRACVIPRGERSVPLNSCYVVAPDDESDAYALAALLNSVVAAAWLNVLAEPARGGYRRYLGWTIAMFPIPRDWRRARAILAPLGESATLAGGIDEAELRAAVLRAYRVRARDIDPLLAWSFR